MKMEQSQLVSGKSSASTSIYPTKFVLSFSETHNHNHCINNTNCRSSECWWEHGNTNWSISKGKCCINDETKRSQSLCSDRSTKSEICTPSPTIRPSVLRVTSDNRSSRLSRLSLMSSSSFGCVKDAVSNRCCEYIVYSDSKPQYELLDHLDHTVKL